MYKILSTLLVCLVLTACAGTPVELNRSTLAARKIESIRLIDHGAKIQHQLTDSAAAAGAGGAGLLGVLVGSAVDSGVNTKRAKSIAPVLEALSDYNPNLYLESALRHEAKGISFVSPVKVLIGGGIDPKLIPSMVPSYTITPDFEDVYVTLSVSMEQPDDEDKEYVNLYTDAQSTDRWGTNEENRQDWIDNPGKLIAKVQAAITGAVQRFVADFNGERYVAAEPAAGDYPIHILPQKNQSEDVSHSSQESHLGDHADHDVAPIDSAYPALVEQLGSPDTMTMRAAAKEVGENELYNDEAILVASVRVLEKNLASGVGTKDKYLIDGLSWCALNLGNARSVESKVVLSDIVASDLPRKLRSHAIHALNLINGEL